MEWKTLKKIADADSISTTVNNDNGIVSVKFTVNNALITAQFSTQNAGIFAFTVWDGAGLLALLGLDENGDPAPDSVEETTGVYISDTAGEDNDE